MDYISGALSTFSHAHKHLLEEDCIVVPDSAVIYAQVVDCPFLQRWNKLEDVVAPELGVVLETPEKVHILFPILMSVKFVTITCLLIEYFITII